AGVTGLTTALLLTRKTAAHITIVAKHLPGDTALEYTSPWAAANFVPIGESEDSKEGIWEKATWAELYRLAVEVPEAGVHIQGVDKVTYKRNEDEEKGLNNWFKSFVPEVRSAPIIALYRFLRDDELPPFADWGLYYKTLALDPVQYMFYLKSVLLRTGRVRFIRKTLSHIREAFDVTGEKVDAVFNCSGLLSAKLGGVMDGNIVPVKGQLVIVQNEPGGMYGISGGDWDENESVYIIARPHAGGTAIGGSSHAGTWDGTEDTELSKRMLERALRICPQMVKPGEGVEGLKVVRHVVGLRPSRVGGPRIERELLDGDEKLKVIHSYGAGGFGYQASYGMAADAVALLSEASDVLVVRSKL
ncbi:FAD dependent oxidoreductase, partial [Ascobolus immersus RN42]